MPSATPPRPPSPEAIRVLRDWLYSFAEKVSARVQSRSGSAQARRTSHRVELLQLPVFNAYSANREATTLYRSRVDPRAMALMALHRESSRPRLTDLESAELRLAAFHHEFPNEPQNQTAPQ